ncbi:MAG: precorrin-6A reductase, partial [Verrucomicrobiota bacterium]
LETEFDMLTTVIIGNRFTRRSEAGMFSPRGYLDWEGSPESRVEELPAGAVWVFSGTHDGNEIARALGEAGHTVIVSAATDYGVEVAKRSLGPSILVINGARGSAKRRDLMKEAAAIVDATHPFAQQISQDLIEASESIGIRRIRFERASEVLPLSDCDEVVVSFEEAIERAIFLGRRIFLATGAKELDKLQECGVLERAEWFVRLAPEASSFEKAIDCGIPRSHLCFMQGPFGADFNETQWRNWEIDCVVTRESGPGSGLKEKQEAAKRMKLPLVMIERPTPASDDTVDSVEGVLGRLSNQEHER